MIGVVHWNLITPRLLLTNCLFYENTSDYGGAINSWKSSVSGYNCTFADNSATSSGGGHRSSTDAVDTYYNTIFYNNNTNIYEKSGATTTLHYSICSGASSAGVSVNNEVSGDPLFTDAANDDYTLQSNSAAVDAGSSSYAPATDINGISRPQSSADDLGYYEYVLPQWTGCRYY